jgi:hypothetical protein
MFYENIPENIQKLLKAYIDKYEKGPEFPRGP